MEVHKIFNKWKFEINEISVLKKYDLKIPTGNSETFGDNRLRSLAPRVWNSLPKHLKPETSYVKFKEEIGVFCAILT